MKAWLVGFALLLGLEGCLGNSYQLSHAELVRLTQSPAEVRGEHVRVLQQRMNSADDLRIEDADYDAPSSTQVSVSVDASSSGGGRYRGVGRGELGPRGPGRAGSGTGHGVSVRGGSSSGVGRVAASSGGSSGGGGGGGSDAVAAAILGVVLAGGVGVYLATVEGRRFDGWARVDADKPLLLVRPDSSSQWLPLSALTERDAASADHAVIGDRDEDVLRLNRAPLSRRGFAYEFELGSARLNTASGVRDFGFASRMGFGYFPAQTLGVLLGGQVTLGRAHDALTDGSVFNGRLFGELEYLPVHAVRFHAGLYAELGGALAIQDLDDKTHSWSGLYASAGFLAQLDWTTRLALNLRGGIAALPAYPNSVGFDRAYIPELSLGVAVY